MSATEIAKTLGVHVSTILRRAEAVGLEPALKVGRANLFRRSDLHRLTAPGMGRPRKGAKR